MKDKIIFELKFIGLSLAGLSLLVGPALIRYLYF